MTRNATRIGRPIDRRTLLQLAAATGGSAALGWLGVPSAQTANAQAAEAEIPIILSKHPLKDPLYHHATYDIACIYALEGKSAEAVKWLRESAVTGFHLYPRYTRDAFLNRIRRSPESSAGWILRPMTWRIAFEASFGRATGSSRDCAP